MLPHRFNPTFQNRRCTSIFPRCNRLEIGAQASSRDAADFARTQRRCAVRASVFVEIKG